MCFEKILHKNCLNKVAPDKKFSQIKILAIADLHYWEKRELLQIRRYDFDLCVLLGDVPLDAIKEIAKIIEDAPILAVPGNHDSWNMFDELPIKNIHGKSEIEIKGITFAGFGGSIRYKNGPYVMYTQEECLKIMKTLPAADILISHDSMYGLFDKSGPHEGLKGITKYINKNNVYLNICGHHHQPCVKKGKSCTTICVYRCALITFPDIDITQIF